MPTPDYSDLAYSMAGVRRANPFDARRRWASQLQAAGSDASPVEHPLQGAARLAQALVGGYLGGQVDRDEASAMKKRETSLAAAMAEPDPQKRIAMLSASDPELGARLSGQLAIEQAKLGQQTRGLETAATNFGSSFGVPAAGAPPGAPTQLAVPPGQAPTGSSPGFANNVGNIRATNINWQDKGQPYNGFETFSTPQAGANAMAQNLQAYIKAQPNMTVADAIKKWAPQNENNTQAYIRGLAEATGINPGMPLAQVLQDQAMAATLMDGIARIEKGGLPQGFTADTFMTAAGPGAPPQVAQGSADPSGTPLPPPGMPPAPAPGAVNGPTMVAPVPPQIPDVPRPQPTPQMVQQYRQRLMSGEFGTGPEAASRARAAIDAELDRQWTVERDRAGRQYDQSQNEYQYQRRLADEAAASDKKRGDEQTKFRTEQAGKLRDDLNGLQSVKDYNKASTVFRSAVEASKQDTKAADINMVYAFATLMDPGSVVRDSETGMVYATQGASDRIKGLVAGLQGKSGLGKDTKAALLREMGGRYESYKLSYDNIAKTFRGIAERGGLNPEDVIIPVEPVDWKTPQEPATPTAGGIPQPKTREEYDRLPNGAQYTAPDGSLRTKGGQQ